MLALPIGKQLTFATPWLLGLSVTITRGIYADPSAGSGETLGRFCGARFLDQDDEYSTNPDLIQPSFWLEEVEPSSHFPRLRSS
jgi:hypothetical protein